MTNADELLLGNEKHANRAHAPCPPSSAYRDNLCSGAVLARTNPDLEPPESAAAKEGTAVHELLEKARRALLDLPVLENAEIQKWCKENIADFEDQSVIAACIQRDRQTEELFAKDAVSVKRYIEHRVRYNEYSWGTLDYGLSKVKHNGRTDVLINDYKNGVHPVHARDNWQLLIYFFGLYTTERLSSIENIYLMITQPRVPGPPVSAWRLTIDQAEEWRPKIDAYLARSVAVLEGRAEPTYVPGEHCKYCWIDGVCAAQKKHNSERGLTLLDAADAKKPVNVELMTLEQMLFIKNNEKEIERVLAGVNVHLQKRLEHGLDVPGYKLVESQTRRSLDDTDINATAAGLRKLGVSQPFRAQLITLGEAEKSIPKSKHDELNKLCKRSTAKRVLAPTDDKRPSVLTGRAIDLLT